MDTETVVRLRPTTNKLDPFSQTNVPDWDGALDELELQTLAPAAPRGSSEPVDEARTPVLDGWTLYLGRDADITARDRVRVRGEVYDVDGTPADWFNEGLVVQAARTKG